jgi:parallel beta-helix repeat protein
MKYDRPHYLFGIVLGGFFIFIIISIIPCQVIAATRYVAPGGNCGGTSPCYSAIQDAVLVSANGDEIRVAAGTYSSTSTGSGITAVVRIKNKKIALRGGYTTSNWNTSDPTANPTIIDANDNGICIYVNYQADTGIGDIAIDGFSITDGSATDAGAGTDSGGGIYIDHTTHVKVSIQNCKIYENYSEDGSGAGIWATRSDNLNVVANEIYDNEGSGVVVTYGDNTVIVDNTIDNNAGDGVNIISDLGGGTDINGNEITDNQGSGINLNTAFGGSINDNVVSGNQKTGGGRGIRH